VTPSEKNDLKIFFCHTGVFRPKEKLNMQLSTDLTYGLRAVQQHIASGAKLPMNVSAEADAAFMRELQREDSQGYDRLMKNIQTAAIRSGRSIEYRSHQAASMRAKAEGL
jgi:hypothetical protein